MTTTINIAQIDELLRADKFDDAKALVQKVLAQPLNDEEKAKSFVSFTTAYIKIMNAINDRYDRALSDVIKDLESLEKENRNLSDKVAIAKVRMSLK